MGGNYQKDLYRQLMEVVAKIDSLESEQKHNKKEIKTLTSEVTSLRKENHRPAWGSFLPETGKCRPYRNM